MTATRRALFLDRDGVVVRETHLLVRPQQLELLPGAAAAIRRARAAGWLAVLVTNQPVVARGLIDEAELLAVHAHLGALLAAEGAALDAVYACPHHPKANLERYRLECECRKPRPGMLLSATRALGIALAGSVMVGDRPSDVAAGARAGCRTVLVRSGAHDQRPIESPDAFDHTTPDVILDDLGAAVDWALGGAS